MRSDSPTTAAGAIRGEMALVVGGITTLVFWLFGKGWLAELSNPAWSVTLFMWLFAAMLWLSFAVVRHAEALAVLLGEPYGTLILTLSVISIEVVMIAAVMLTGEPNPTLARDAMFAVLMIVLGGMVGLSLLVGGVRHHEQEYNLQGANAYLSVILPMAVLGLMLPRFIESTPDGAPSPALAVFLILVSVLLYGVFLAMQTTRHRAFFLQPGGDGAHDEHAHAAQYGITAHAILLLVSMLPIVLLAKSMAALVEHAIVKAGAPTALGGFFVAFLVLAPEGLGAVRAALANQMQRAMNICLGSALATIGLTVPAVLVIGMVTGHRVELGLNNVDMLLLVLSLAVSVVTFTATRTNVVQGAVHLVLFAAYIVTIFD